jgi:archaellin
VYERVADSIGPEWAIILIAVVIVAAIYLMIGRSK